MLAGSFKRIIGKKIVFLYNKIMKIPRPIKRFLLFLFSLFLVFIIADLVFPIKIKKDYSIQILDKNGELLHSFLTADEKWRLYIQKDEITPLIEKAFLFKEDKYFHYHPGINPVSVIRAFLLNIKERRRISGASTITMQVARLLEPKERTYFNKIIEVFRAFQLEWHYKKDEILQLYLNLIPFGGNIEGIKAASAIYFNKSPDHLSLAEIVALSIIPNRPLYMVPGVNNDRIFKTRNQWLKKLNKARTLDSTMIKDAMKEPLLAFRRNMPHNAPHLSMLLKEEIQADGIIKSFIDPKFQKEIEDIVREYNKKTYFQNIRNAAVLVVENKSGKVMAYIGSADYYNEEDGGQVDGINAIRSPGSTLKPVLYGLAMDAGVVTPKLHITDVPVSYSGYEPENYSGSYHGSITLEYALQKSLNVPAVKILAELSVDRFIESLSKCGFSKIENDKSKLGLSVILGGCGVSLKELTGVYAAIANQGEYKPLVFSENDRNISRGVTQMISPESAFMITEILTDLSRPDLPIEWENEVNMPKIAWKTGTSYGRRDAWSIGFNQKYTVGVWVGNFSGTGVPDLTGASKAAPLLFRVFNAIDYRTSREWFQMPDNLGLRYVCSQTGKPPGTYCDDLVLDYYIPGTSSTLLCDHMKEMWISPDSGISYCTSCRPEKGYIKALMPNIPADIIQYYEANNIPYTRIPPHNPHCERIFTGSAPEIISPVSNNRYFIDRNDTLPVKLSCNTTNDVNKVFWYVNDQYIKSSNPVEEVFIQPPAGKVKISCSDDKGRNADIFIEVKYIRF